MLPEILSSHICLNEINQHISVIYSFEGAPVSSTGFSVSSTGDSVSGSFEVESGWQRGFNLIFPNYQEKNET